MTELLSELIERYDESIHDRHESGADGWMMFEINHRIKELENRIKVDTKLIARLEADNAALQRQVERLRRILYLETANWPKANIPRNYELIHDHQRGIVDVKAREGYTIDGATLKGGE